MPVKDCPNCAQDKKLTPKVKRCTHQVMKLGHEKSSAIAICRAAIGDGFLTDTRDAATWKIDEDTRFLTAPVVLARTGAQSYFGFELGLKDRALEKINVYRSPEEVFSPAAMQSYQNLVIVDDHPNQAVTVDNVKKLQVGSVSNVDRDGETTKGLATVTDKEEIRKIQGGKVEVSVGYSQDLKPCGKTVDGLLCEFEQTNIKGNHLAIVDAGRCGGACRILNDKKMEGNLPSIILDGITYETEDSQLAQAVSKFVKDAEEKENAFMKKLKKGKEEKEDMEKEKEEAVAEKEAAEKTKMKDSDIEKMINDKASAKAELISKAKVILGDKMPDCVDCDMEIMKAVIGNDLKDELMGQSEDYAVAYVTALFNDGVKKFENGREKTQNLGDEITKDKDGKEITRDSSRDKYIQETLDAGVK